MNGRLLRSIGVHGRREQFFRLDSLAAAPYMGDIVPVDYALVCRFTVIAFVGAKMLSLSTAGSGRLMTMLSKTVSS